MTKQEIIEELNELPSKSGQAPVMPMNLVKKIVNLIMGATGTYKALVTQTADNDPTVVELENTLGVNITFSRATDGRYFLIADSPVFVEGETFMMIQQQEGKDLSIEHQSGSSTAIAIASYSSGVPSDDLLNNTSIEITTYGV